MEMNTHVAILKLFPGLRKEVLDGVLNIPGLKGLILETYGAGNAPTEPWLLEALATAIAGGLHIIDVTQCSGGSVLMGQYETSEALRKIDVINGKDITTEAAITKLMYMLGNQVSQKAFKTIFETSLRGEMV
jgi:L-asparaginase